MFSSYSWHIIVVYELNLGRIREMQSQIRKIYWSSTSISTGIGITPKRQVYVRWFSRLRILLPSYTEQIFAVFDKCKHENVKNLFVYVEINVVYVKLNVEYVNKFAPYVEKCKHST